MYLGFVTGWIGLWIVFGQANPAAIVVAFGGVALFVVFYEEPTLRRKFGAEMKYIAGMCRAGYHVYIRESAGARKLT